MQTTRRDLMGLAATAALVAPAFAPGPALAAPSGGGLRLVSFVAPGSKTGMPVPGVVGADNRVVALAHAAPAPDMIGFITLGDSGLDHARMLASREDHAAPALDNVRLVAPIPAPARNIYAVGWNYLEHFSEAEQRYGKIKLPARPVFFTKGTHTINGPFDPIPFDPAVSSKIDWEGELAVIIGKRGRNIREADAMSYVYGYSVINDTTARDMQVDHGGQWFKGKSLDGHGPMGPWIIPAADLDYDNLDLTTRVNGVVKQQVNTSKMYFKIPRLIAELSLGLTLEPGDIIATGTPSGIGAARTPPEFLRPGDVMETEISQIGTLRNPIRQV